MNNPIILSALGIGIAIIVAFFILWYLIAYFKRRTGLEVSNAAEEMNLRFTGERREEPRADVSWEAILHTSGGSMGGRLKNVTRGGAFVACEYPMSPKDTLRIGIKLPNGKWIELEAEVVWSNANVPEAEVVLRGMGVRFLRVGEEDHKEIRNAISHLRDG
ncbi:MAG: PilZ domain-containing protein [Deltaproteobacteria bacterium]|nr:PilZ domain-containing protein [Deltaproteobacteria bacterium]MBW2137854.1 PilZ domain-containing protein [Deltaproteobacteria bacterium]